MISLFTYEEGSLFLRLLLAHIVIDFFLQTDKSVLQKKKLLLKAPAFWLHGLYTALVAALFMGSQFNFWVLLLITVSHLCIDYGKLVWGKRHLKGNATPNELWPFIIDQLLHTLVLVLAWLILVKGFHKMWELLHYGLPHYRFLVRVAAYFIAIGPVTYLVKFLTTKWAPEVNESAYSLKDAGKWIGILERVLVITLVLLQQYGAIGFLIAAKSILRLIDKPEFTTSEAGAAAAGFSARKHTEYVLIGTFISFGTALMIGLMVNWLLQL